MPFGYDSPRTANLSVRLPSALLRARIAATCSGVIFLRRKLDDPLYKYVLRQFVGYIVQKRFNLSWSIEGTRYRTGKMLPPKLGLLSYVDDAYLDGQLLKAVRESEMWRAGVTVRSLRPENQKK